MVEPYRAKPIYVQEVFEIKRNKSKKFPCKMYYAEDVERERAEREKEHDEVVVRYVQVREELTDARLRAEAAESRAFKVEIDCSSVVEILKVDLQKAEARVRELEALFTELNQWVVSDAPLTVETVTIFLEKLNKAGLRKA